MGRRNVLVEGVSGAGKTSVCHELRRRGHHAINGDTDLAYQGDPRTGLPTDAPPSHWQHLWDVDAVRTLVEDDSDPVTFFCGGSRNHAALLPLFDVVVVLTIDRDTLERRLDSRAPDEYGASGEERELVLRLHRTGEDSPRGATPVDATMPLAEVVDEVLRLAAP